MIGIYCLRNLSNGKRYIGQSIDLERRKKTHFYYLRKNKHYNKHLQNSWNKYGEENFIFEILIKCHKDELSFYEKEFIKKYSTFKKDFGYNKDKGGVYNRDWHHTKSAKDKISKANKGVRKSKEHRRKLSESHKGKIISVETRIKMSEAKKGKKLSEMTKQKIGAANKGQKNGMFGVELSLDEKILRSSRRNSTGFFRVTKDKDPTISQGFNYTYQYYDENKKRKKIRRVNIKDLEKAVKNKGLPWIKLEDKNK